MLAVIRRFGMCWGVSWGVMSLTAGAVCGQHYVEDEDFPPGLLARYEAGGKHIERIDLDVAFEWGTAAPDARVPAGEFAAQWNGRLLVREQGEYQFHAYVVGEVTLKIGGREVLQGNRAGPGWLSSANIAVPFGEQEFHANFKKTEPNAQLKLYWSSDRFPLEPIPAHLLFRSEPRDDLYQIERGRVQFDALRCNRCHRRDEDLPSAPGPDLTRLVIGDSPGWLIEKLLQQNPIHEHDKMPAFGFNQDEATAIAAFLSSSADGVKLAKLKPVKNETQERQAGETLLHSLGCLGCHRVGELGTIGPFGGGDLTHIGSKRSPEWLDAWLKEPAKLNADHRMPVFTLSTQERTQLVLALAKRQTDPAAATDAVDGLSTAPEVIEAGRQLVVASRCAACHRIPGIKPNVGAIPDLSQPVEPGAASCLDKSPNRARHQPAYPAAERDAIAAYLGSRRRPLSPESQFTLGQRVVERLNCLACHERELAKGIVPTAGRVARLVSQLEGESQALIPPALTAVGDKLHDKALSAAVVGGQPRARLPWLRIRMPKFQHSDAERDALTAFLIGHDRIPAGAPGIPSAPELTAKEESQWLLAGHELVGPKGFSCIACHAAGSYVPKNVALGTRGSDILQLAGRMRREYFLRWTRSPLRIVPGMEMPSYVKPAPGILDGAIDTQLAALWQAINDPRFTVPTNPTAVEQFFVVKPGQPARIVRDVFTHPDANGGGTIPRAFAVGLPNGHNVLYDLGTFALRQWAVGDFGRQRSVGKSWYWDMAGVHVMSGLGTRPDVALIASDQSLIFPLSEHGTVGWLDSYQLIEQGVRFEYRLQFELPDGRRTVTVTETVRPMATGWTRTIRVADVPAALRAVIAVPNPTMALGNARIEMPQHGDAQRLTVGEGNTAIDVVQLPKSADAGDVEGTLRYVTDIQRSEVEPQLKPEANDEPRLEAVTTLPGFEGARLPLPQSIMPTAMTWLPDGTLAFATLKGHVYLAHDTDGDGFEDQLTTYEEGLAAPFGLIADGNDLIVAHKPELLRLRDTNGDRRADLREVFATGWGYTDNYHDWTSGIVRDSGGHLYVGLGSDYTQPQRPPELRRWRGKVLRISPDGSITPFAHGLRYPMGLAIDARDRVFVSDQQGDRNPFNEINYLIAGRYCAFPSMDDRLERPDTAGDPPAVQVPHPWTRSVNGLTILPENFGRKEFAGHGIGCEYNHRFLMRFTYEEVAGVMQGAAYEFSLPNETGSDNFLGPMVAAVSPQGDLYVGSIEDSGWRGGRNTGGIVRLRPQGEVPLGIREVRATADGFEIEFTRPVDVSAAAKLENYSVSGYTRAWKGGYATADSGRHASEVTAADVSPNGRTVRLTVEGRRTGYVYELNCRPIGRDGDKPLFPATAHYTLHRIPQAK